MIVLGLNTNNPNYNEILLSNDKDIRKKQIQAYIELLNDTLKNDTHKKLTSVMRIVSNSGDYPIKLKSFMCIPDEILNKENYYSLLHVKYNKKQNRFFTKTNQTLEFGSSTVKHENNHNYIVFVHDGSYHSTLYNVNTKKILHEEIDNSNTLLHYVNWDEITAVGY